MRHEVYKDGVLLAVIDANATKGLNKLLAAFGFTREQVDVRVARGEVSRVSKDGGPAKRKRLSN